MLDDDKGNPSDMDAVLAYRNLLAAEDHLDELYARATTSEDKCNLEAMLEDTIALREVVMPKEANPIYHCLVKHYATAYEAAREVWKDTRTAGAWWAKTDAYNLLITALEMLWGRKIITCERCDYAGAGQSLGPVPGHGQSRDSVPTVSLGGGLGIQSLPDSGAHEYAASTSGSTTSKSQGESFTKH